MSAGVNNIKFIRRHDLSPARRLIIAYTAWMSQRWGAVTQLAKTFLISRTFVYMLRRDLELAIPIIFGEQTVPKEVISKRDCVELILSMRLEGKCAIHAISTILNRLGYPYHSVGFISQILNSISALLDNTIATGKKTIQLAIFASDEIFSKTNPILITVDAVSSIILRIELADSRNAAQWKQHWECIQQNGCYAVYLVSDEGTGMKSAKKQILNDLIHQPDTFHAVSHQLGLWVNRLEQSAYKAIQNTYDCYDKLDSAVSDRVIDNRIEAYQQAEKAANAAIELYDEFHEYYLFLIEQLKVFDEVGNVRDRTKAEENFQLALDLLETLKNTRINQTVKKIRAILPDLFAYLDRAVAIVNELGDIGISEEVLRLFCLAWQYRKNIIKAKHPRRSDYFKNKEKLTLAQLNDFLGDKYTAMLDIVYAKLDGIVQSSALVETINSIVRSYLNTTRNHISQDLLNLIMFYHNHRRYLEGKRKGKTPFEIFSGTSQNKDWLHLLLEIVERKEPAFLLN